MSNTVPERWLQAVLQDFAEINPRLTQRADLRDDTPVSFIKMEDVSNNAYVKNVRTMPYKKVSKGFTRFQNHDVLLAKITPCFENGKGGYAEQLESGVGFGSTEFHVLRAKSNSDSRFLFQYINYPAFRMNGESNMTGSAGQRRVPTEFLRSYPVVLPPLPEQQKIATILSSVDNVIETTRAQIDKLKDLKTGMMQELLTKGIGLGGVPHTEFKDSPVGRIPATWEVHPLGALCDLQVGYAFKSSWFSGSGIKLLRGDNVGYGRPTWDRTRYLSKEKVEKFKDYLLSAGDLIIGMDRTFTKSGTKLSKLEDSDVPALLVQRVGKFVPKCSHKEFIWHLIRSTRFTDSLKSEEKGMDIPHLSKAEILTPLVAVPPIDEQQKIAEILTSHDDLLAAKEMKLDRAMELKKALMQDLLTGKVRVNIEQKEKEPVVA